MSDGKETAIVPQESREEWLPVMTVEQAVIRYQEMQRFVKSVLKEGTDFGTIPGTGTKPTLLKPGAEKFAKFFGLGIEHELVDSTEDWEKGFFNYRYKIIARSLRSGAIIATGEGSCNSKEKKYRIRYVPEFAATDEEKQRVLHRETRTSKKGNSYVMLTILNDDPYSIVNTIQKMAYKRALVAAVLVAANASDYFTQDIEDMAPEVINGDFVETKDVTPKKKSKKAKNTNDLTEAHIADYRSQAMNDPVTIGPTQFWTIGHHFGIDEEQGKAIYKELGNWADALIHVVDKFGKVEENKK